MATEFKKGRRQFRRRKESSSDSEADSDSSNGVSDIVNNTKEIQKLRRRAHGVDAESLAVGKELPKEEKVDNDPYKLKTGGFIDMKKMKGRLPPPIEDTETIGTSFAAETNRRDEDAQMYKYVEVELAKRRGGTSHNEEEEKKSKNPEDALYELPEHLQVASSRKKTEDMLSYQMLSGIPEVDLGIDAKIRNIEATEEAKQKLIDERNKKDSEVSAFVPTNMAVNFVQHNRFNIEDSTPLLKKQEEAPKPPPVRVGDAERQATGLGMPSIVVPGDKRPASNTRGDRDRHRGEKATDDFHYEKFKKQMRRF